MREITLSNAEVNPIPDPQYVHDCSACHYLGRILSPEGTEEWDVYFCGKSEDGSVILRHGNDGPQYASMPSDLILSPAHLMESLKDPEKAKRKWCWMAALVLVQRRNYFKEEDPYWQMDYDRRK